MVVSTTSGTTNFSFAQVAWLTALQSSANKCWVLCSSALYCPIWLVQVHELAVLRFDRCIRPSILAVLGSLLLVALRLTRQ